MDILSIYCETNHFEKDVEGMSARILYHGLGTQGYLYKRTFFLKKSTLSLPLCSIHAGRNCNGNSGCNKQADFRRNRCRICRSFLSMTVLNARHDRDSPYLFEKVFVSKKCQSGLEQIPKKKGVDQLKILINPLNLLVYTGEFEPKTPGL